MTIHAELLTNYLNKFAINDEEADTFWDYAADTRINDFDSVQSLLLDVDDYSDKQKNINKKLVKEIESKPLIFGNISNDVGYILSVKNVSKKAAADLVKRHFNFKKVYISNVGQYKYVRLATI